MIREALITLITVSALVIVLLYVVINGFYVIVHLMGAFELQTQQREKGFDASYGSFDSRFLPGIAIIVAAYNEEETIVDSVRSLLDLEYADRSIIVCNDGSDDDTLDELIEAYEMELIDEHPPWHLDCEPVIGIYRSKLVDDLFVIDKAHGGKSDALNAGISFTEQPLICTVDADSLIDRNGLRRAIAPFVAHPKETVASGGTVRVANGSTIEGGQVLQARMSDKTLVQLQELEYLRAFYSGRLGLSRLRNLLVISGTFGVFRTDIARAIGGYRRDTVTEDLDLVVRIHRYMKDTSREYRIEFVSEPIVWTQVPESRVALSHQRRRWYRGLLEVLTSNRDMFGKPRYGVVGTVALPMHLLAEGIGPLIEAYGYIIVPLAFFLGILNIQFFLMFLIVIIGIGVFLSLFGVFSEVWSYRRYDRPRQIAILLGVAVLENFGYRQWRAFVSMRGFVEFLRRDARW